MYMLVRTDPWMPAGALALAAHADSMAISWPLPPGWRWESGFGRTSRLPSTGTAYYVPPTRFPSFSSPLPASWPAGESAVMIFDSSRSNGIGARFKLIRDTVAARPKFWCPLSMLKYFMYFCGLGKAAYLYKSVGGMFSGERGQQRNEVGLWSIVLHSLIRQQDRARRTVCSTNTKVEHWAWENGFSCLFF